MNNFYKGGRGPAFSQREGGASSRKEKPRRLSKILTYPLGGESFRLPSVTVREVVGVSSKYPRDLFDTGSGAVREVFDCCSGGSRRTTEAHPKQYRSCPEPVPKRTRSAPEGHPNSTRRNRLFFYRFFDVLKAGIKYRCSKDVVPFTQRLRKIAEVPLMYRECTVSVRGVYRKGTGEVLESYWRPTKDPLNTCTSGVDQRYNKSGGVVRRKASHSRSRIKCLQPIAYGLQLIICFMLFNLSTAWAQSAEPRTAEGQTEIKPLKIGDTIPEELWNLPLQVVNHPEGKDTITLNDYRDKKLIILDFWATWCGICLQFMPGLDSLQKSFDAELQVIMASSEKGTSAAGYIKRENYSLMSVVNDKILAAYFPHLYKPYNIWIKDNKVWATTEPVEINESTISRILRGQRVNIQQREDDLFYDIKKPLLIAGNGSSSRGVLAQSLLAGYLEGAISSSTFFMDEERRQGKVIVTNSSMLAMYKTALLYINPALRIDSRIRYETKLKDVIDNRANHYYLPDSRKDFYSYELILPEADKPILSAYMFDDLNRYFDRIYGVKAVIEKRKEKSWILRRDTISPPLPSKFSKEMMIETEDHIEFQSTHFKTFAATLERINSDNDTPILDKSGLDIRMDLSMPKDLTNLAAVSAALRKYGIILQSEDVLVDMLIFKEISN